MALIMYVYDVLAFKSGKKNN